MVDGRVLLVDLILLKLLDFDIILRMKWLVQYYISLDCWHKIMTFGILK